LRCFPFALFRRPFSFLSTAIFVLFIRQEQTRDPEGGF
jgi:hypothetical protein